MSMLQPDDAMLAASGVEGPTWADKIGGFNEMPPNWKPITESEFMWRFQGHRPHEYRQVKRPAASHGGGPETVGARELYLDVHLWVAPDFSGIGFIKHYNGRATRTEIDAYWPEYFSFAYCEHEFETTAHRMCYWEGKCRKCGFVKFVDSSD